MIFKQSMPLLLAWFALMPVSAYFDRTAAIDESAKLIRAANSHATAPALKVRARLLELTPLGSSPEQVQYSVVDVLHKTFNGYHKNFEMPRTSGADVTWYFDDQEKLMNIVVWEHPEGL